MSKTWHNLVVLYSIKAYNQIRCHKTQLYRIGTFDIFSGVLQKKLTKKIGSAEALNVGGSNAD